MQDIDIQKKWEELSSYNREFNFRDFSNLDESPDAKYLIRMKMKKLQ